MTVCRRLLDLRHDNIIVPVVKPLRERVLARHDLRPPVLLDLVLIERTGRGTLCVERPVLADTPAASINVVVKAHVVLVAALRNAAICHASRLCGLTMPWNFAAVNGCKLLQRKIAFSQKYYLLQINAKPTV